MLITLKYVPIILKLCQHNWSRPINNTAMTVNGNGGGISLKKSRLEIRGNCQIVNNSALRGGGIYASSSTIAVYQPGNLQLTNNSAQLGGGAYLEVNPELYILENRQFYLNQSCCLNFTGNHASSGGALYVADDTDTGSCSDNNECFIQTLDFHPILIGPYERNTMSRKMVHFSRNTATRKGSNLFGGLLDRCIPSQLAGWYYYPRIHYSGAAYLRRISNINTTLGSINSQPVRVCFCNSTLEPDCSYQPSVVRVKKGEEFNVLLVAVDQLSHPVDAEVITSLSSYDSGLSYGQHTQAVTSDCTNLTLNVISPHDFETINIFPDGPCGSAALSTSHVTIEFIECTCPLGFVPLQIPTRCECVCDSALSPYISECNITAKSVLRRGTNSWITYINDTDPPAYVIYPNCPFDYCQPQTESVTINFNLPKGADLQCANNRTGMLCGTCKQTFSISLASSRCVPCNTHWVAAFIFIILLATIAGVLLVAALLALNMTVAVGLINGFIFYANLVSAGSGVFFPSSEPTFPSVFTAWLNLDIGFDVCFIDGLDAYSKTWLQLAFPVYVISLVFIVIIVSKYCSKLTVKRDPKSTLATLVLLSYAKLLSVTITALSSAVLQYPGGKRETVWLPDGNVKFFQGKHIPLALVALLIILIGVPYIILLFLYQLVDYAPTCKVFQWAKNSKLNAFFANYYAPYTSKYRYWTGLLLLVRVVLYITATVTVSTNPQTFLLIMIILVGAVILIGQVLGQRVYQNYVVNLVNTVLYFNLLTFALFTLYEFRANVVKQTAVAYISTMVTFILFIGAISYHVMVLKKKREPSQNLPFVSVQLSEIEDRESDQEPQKDEDIDEKVDLEDYHGDFATY